MRRSLYLFLVIAMLIGLIPYSNLTLNAVEDIEPIKNKWEGKTVSILSHSASTYEGVSNDIDANSTIGTNDVYYTEGRHDVYLKDTWWQQTIDALGMRLLVNNSWSGSCVFMPRKGENSVGYGDRAINLHNDHTGEEPDIIFIYLGCNDFAYYKDTFGKAADVNYGLLIQDKGDGSFDYSEPQTTCEAYAIMLHKVTTRYPDAKIYCMTSTARRDPDFADNYADTGQPTEYSAELHKIALRFGFPVIDLENCISKEAEIFDQYMGDKRAHPNALGMDRITNEVLSVMLNRDAEICHVTSKDGTIREQAVLLGDSYYTKIEEREDYSVVVTMGGMDITAEVYNNGIISIPTITGDIEIHSSLQRNPLNFRWEIKDDSLISVGESENKLTNLAGTITNSVLNNTRYKLSNPVILKHNLAWEIEWQFSENWRGCLFASDPIQQTKGMIYLSRTVGGQLCFGTWDGQQYNNYGVDLSYLDDQIHTYRLVNRISADGSNMVWAYVDGEQIGPMNNYYIGSREQGKTSDWVSGKDFLFHYISMDGHALKNCHFDYLEIKECNHTYKNGICTACGEEHPNLDIYKGKVISILSASTSTFDGYIPKADGFNLEHRPRYPQSNLLTDVNDTWWMQAIAALNAKLGINDSWAGSQVLNILDKNSGDLGPDAAMASITRIKNLGANGTPDVILFFGGGNDMGRGVPLGSFNPASAPTEVDLTAIKWESFADAYVAAIMRMQYYYPDTKIVAMTTYAMPSYVTQAKLDKYGPVIKAICEHYGVEYLSLEDCGVTFDMLPDNIHPNAEGMDHITTAVVEKLLCDVEIEAGEHTVHAVTHELNQATASLSYYKGVSVGNSFEETLTGDDLTVRVTMGGLDITNSCYKDGRIYIESVTGDIVITAKGKFTANGHLQELPDQLCANTNLWTALTPENIYYTASGWGNTAAGTSWSITFPVNAGDKIWATSLGPYPGNGSSANGVRVTWFDENGMMLTLDRNTVYNEFAKYGYITAPEGAVALNLPMTNNIDGYAVYIISAEHTYTSIVTLPTCIDGGYTTYTCKCGESYTGDRVESVGHSFGEWFVVDNPTCVSEGIKQHDCASCNYHETEIIPASGHSYIKKEKPPTCTEKGYTTYTCECGESYTGDHVEAVGHGFGEWFTVSEATCTADGLMQRDCLSCDLCETERIPASGHYYASEVTLPTCTERGYTTYTCDCKDSYISNYKDALGHIYGGWKSEEECHWRECTVCKAQESEKEKHTDSDNNGLCDLCSKQMAIVSDDTGEANENPSAKESIIVMFFELLIELIKDIFKAIFGA